MQEAPKPSTAKKASSTKLKGKGKKGAAGKKKSTPNSVDDLFASSESAEPAKKGSSGGGKKKKLFDDDEDDSSSNFDVFGTSSKKASKGKGKNKKNLFDDDEDDLFNFDGLDDDGGASLDILNSITLKTKKGKKGSAASSGTASQTSFSKTQQELESKLKPKTQQEEGEENPEDILIQLKKENKNDPGRFRYVDNRIRFKDANQMVELARQRFSKLESLIKSLDIQQANRSELTLPDYVLRESVAQVVRASINKEKELRQKELLIEALNIETTSTFEKEEILKQMEFKEDEIKAELKRTDDAQAQIEELQQKIASLQEEIKNELEETEKKCNEMEAKNYEDIMNEANESYKLQEPFLEKLKEANMQKINMNAQLRPMQEENETLKAGINMDDFEEVMKIRKQAPKVLRNAIETVRDNSIQTLLSAFRPLKDYTGSQIGNAVKNVLQKEAKKVLP